MKEKCNFLRPNGACGILTNDVCIPDGCSFYKTTEQYRKDYNKAVLNCRQKELCHRCQYTGGKPCELLKMEESDV